MVWLAAKKTTCAKAALPRYEPSPQGLVFVTVVFNANCQITEVANEVSDIRCRIDPACQGASLEQINRGVIKLGQQI